MKSLAKIFFCGAAIFGMTVLFSSCTDTNEPEPGPEKPDMVGQSIFVPNEMNAEVTVSMEFEADDWTISNTNTWMDVYPYSGNAGVQEITVEVLGLNEELTERVAGFMVKDNGSNIQYYVIQDPVAGWNITSRTASVSGEAQSYTFSVQGNLDFEAVVAEGVDWLTIDSITESDSSLLADNATYSAYRTYNINMSIAANDGEVRTAEITLNGVDGVTTETIEVSQMGELVADFSREFLRRSVVLKITGNWCGWCPSMSQAVHDAMEQYPNHIELINMYTNSQGLTFSDITTFERLFGTNGGAPYSCVNYYAEVPNYSSISVTTQAFVRVANEASSTEELKSNSVLGGIASLDGNTVTAKVNVATKEAGSYYVSAFLLEDGVIGQQADYAGIVSDTRNYEHNDIARALMTEPFGDAYEFSAEGNQVLTFSVEVPSSVQNEDNLHVVVFVAKEGTFSGSVSNADYSDFGYVVDNVVDIPVGGFAIFEYEN